MAKMKTRTKMLPFALFGALTLLGTACSGDGEMPDPGVCDYSGDPAGEDCQGCQVLDECCTFSVNCPAGAICNDPADELYDATKESGICLKVICDGDGDCEGGKTCSLEKLCALPTCVSSEQDCPGGQVCLNGNCTEAPGVENVATCEVVTKPTAIREGAMLELIAVGRNANGKVLPLIPFDWTSPNENVASVAGTTATGGTEQGSVSITAQVSGRTDVTCEGSADITNFPNVAAGDVRVVLVSDTTGAPVDGATVVVEAGGTLTGTTDANGSATVATGAAVDSVTITKAGYQSVSIIQPGTNDIFLPFPEIAREDVAGGFRGKIDLSGTDKADIQLGIAGPAIPSNLLDLDLAALLGDSVPTIIDVPELGLDMQDVDLPGGVMLGLGSKRFTADATRCQRTGSALDAYLGDDDLGCFLARAPEGRTAGWAFAGQLRIADLTAIASQITAAVDGGGDDLPIGELFTAVLPLLRSLNHAVAPAIEVTEAPLNGGEPDYATYVESDLDAGQSLSVLSKVTVPNLPNLPGGGCASGAILISGVNLEGRGVVPLGLTAGLDTLEDGENPDCVINGIDKPFGEASGTLADGIVPLSMAPPHSGIEGNDLFFMLLALDIDGLTSGAVQLAAIVDTKDTIRGEDSVSGSFMAFPEATVNATGITLDSALAGATVVRFEVQNAAGDSWLIYAPGSTTNITYPAAGPAAITNALDDAYVIGMDLGGDFSSVFEFGSVRTLDRIFQNVNGFVIQQCEADPGALCELAP